MKLTETIKTLPLGDRILVTTEHSDLIYEGRAEDVGKGLMEKDNDAEVLLISPDWQEQAIIVILQD